MEEDKLTMVIAGVIAIVVVIGIGIIWSVANSDDMDLDLNETNETNETLQIDNSTNETQNTPTTPSQPRPSNPGSNERVPPREPAPPVQEPSNPPAQEPSNPPGDSGNTDETTSQ